MLRPNYKNFQKGKVVKGNIKGKRKGGMGGGGNVSDNDF